VKWEKRGKAKIGWREGPGLKKRQTILSSPKRTVQTTSNTKKKKKKKNNSTSSQRDNQTKDFALGGVWNVRAAQRKAPNITDGKKRGPRSEGGRRRQPIKKQQREGGMRRSWGVRRTKAKSVRRERER